MSGPYRDDPRRVRRRAELTRTFEPARLVFASLVLVLGSLFYVTQHTREAGPRTPGVFSEEWLRDVSPWQPVVEGCLPPGAEPFTATVEFHARSYTVTFSKQVGEAVGLCVTRAIGGQLFWRFWLLPTGPVTVHVR